MAENPKPKKPPAPPSEEFIEAFRDNTAGLVRECGFCGRLYFGTNGDYEKGEREGYEAEAKKNPDKFIAVEDFSRVMTLSGKEWVLDCPCNAARPYEDFIWANRHQIVKYLQNRNLQHLDDATRLKVNLEGAVRVHDEMVAGSGITGNFGSPA